MPPVVSTETGTTPSACAGVVAVIVEALTTTTFVASRPSNLTIAPATKSVPRMTTFVPPAGGPADGVTDAIDGVVSASSRYVNCSGEVLVPPSGLISTTVCGPPAGHGGAMKVTFTDDTNEYD